MIRKFQYNKNPEISGYYSIRDANKLSAVWAYLGRFKSVEYTKEVLSGQIVNHGGLIDKKAEQIAYTLRQAEQYFVSARNADISIKPLLIYYGIVGLAKVLIISGDNEYEIGSEALNSHHGITWKSKSSDQKGTSVRNSMSLAGEFCQVQAKGIYPLFRSCYCETAIPSENQKIEMKQLLSLIGENWKKYHDFFHEAPNTYNVDGVAQGGFKKIDDSRQIVIFGSYSYIFQGTNNTESFEDRLKRLFPELSTLYEPTTESRKFTSKDDITSLDSHIVFSRTEGMETFALIQPFPDFKLTDFDIYFLTFFILGSLARYRQDKWHKITQRLSEKDEFFLVENLFEIVQYRFPLLILRELEQKDYEFVGEPALWG